MSMMVNDRPPSRPNLEGILSKHMDGDAIAAARFALYLERRLREEEVITSHWVNHVECRDAEVKQLQLELADTQARLKTAHENWNVQMPRIAAESAKNEISRLRKELADSTALLDWHKLRLTLRCVGQGQQRQELAELTQAEANLKTAVGFYRAEVEKLRGLLNQAAELMAGLAARSEEQNDRRNDLMGEIWRRNP